jgi:hypothetical protein
MMVVIDRRRQMIVDRSSLNEIVGAVAVDLDAGTVEIVELTYRGEVHTSHHFPGGLRVIRRYPR